MFTISPSPPPPARPSEAAAAGDVTGEKKKRRPAGTPDPDAEVVSLSPRTLLESDRYVCEICNQGFQRDQNLQMHRRRHKVPWKLLKRDSDAAASAPARKRVFVCPEPTCLHHDPCHALGDLVGIKKHFRRKHSAHKQWSCSRCSKAYAVQSDYKAHLKTCGTRGHSCDCGRIFSRVETFIEHQDYCSASRARAEPRTPQQPAALFRAASSPSTSTDTRPGGPPAQQTATVDPGEQWSYEKMPPPAHHSLELQLLPPPSSDDATDLHLSIGPPLQRVDGNTRAAGEAREQARQQMEMAERELAAARRIRQQAQAEFQKACALRAAAARKINSVLLQITCSDCQQRLRRKPAAAEDGGEEVQPQSVPVLFNALRFG